MSLDVRTLYASLVAVYETGRIVLKMLRPLASRFPFA